MSIPPHMFPANLCSALVVPGRILHRFNFDEDFQYMVVNVVTNNKENDTPDNSNVHGWTLNLSYLFGGLRPMPVIIDDDTYIDLNDVAVRDAAYRFICGFLGAPGRPAWLECGGDQQMDGTIWWLRSRITSYVEDAPECFDFKTSPEGSTRMVILKKRERCGEMEVTVMVPGLRADMSEVEALALILREIHASGSGSTS